MKGAPAFDVVVADEAGPHQFVAAGEIALQFVLDRLPDRIFGRPDGERRIGGDHSGVVAHKGLEIARRQHTIDEPHDAGLLRGELAGGEENLLGERRSDQIDQLFQPGIDIAKPEFCGRHGET